MTQQQLLVNACNIVATFIKDEFVKQGHSMTQAWEDSMVVEAEDGGAAIWASGYGMILDAGVTPDRIPFGGVGTGGGGVSKYILGLARFWKLRKPGISDKAALRLAVATANVQKNEGMPTSGSLAFSSTGQRKHFMAAMEVLVADRLNNFIAEGISRIVSTETKEQKVMYL